MSAAELSMVSRETKFGYHNLAIGEPYFLQEALESFYPTYGVVNRHAHKYPLSQGLAALQYAIIAEEGHHLKGFKHVVITAGAKQGLLAAFAGLKGGGVTGVILQEPYWPSLPGLIQRGGLTVMPSSLTYLGAQAGLVYQSEQVAQLVVLPNNPTGTDVKKPNSDYGDVVWDAVYASPLYGDYNPVDADIIVGSLSKIYGLSGLRIGWAAFKDPKAAREAALYVESTTSGISSIAQNYALGFLQKVQTERNWFEFLRGIAADTLRKNAGVFNQYIRPFTYNVSGIPSGHGGMFAWFQPADYDAFTRALRAARITLVDGVHAGKPGFYRMNLGLTADIFESACRDLNTALDPR